MPWMLSSVRVLMTANDTAIGVGVNGISLPLRSWVVTSR